MSSAIFFNLCRRTRLRRLAWRALRRVNGIRHLSRQSQPAVARPLGEDRDGWVETLRVGAVAICQSRGNDDDADQSGGADGREQASMAVIAHESSVTHVMIGRVDSKSGKVKLK
jgi:hypothetical protein